MQPITPYIIKCGFRSDNGTFCPAFWAVRLDSEDARNPHLIIHAERYILRIRNSN
jgi:hypothetical protein